MTDKVQKIPRKVPVHIQKDRFIQRLHKAEQALSAAVDVEQVKLVMDVAAAQEIFARRQKLGERVIGMAFELKIYSLVRLGELLIESPLRPGPKGPSTSLADLGITRNESVLSQGLARLPADVQKLVALREIPVNRALSKAKARKVRERVHEVEIPAGKFRVIYADPPWRYGTPQHGTEEQVTVLSSHYPDMSVDEICALPVRDMAASSAVLFLWATSPLLFAASRVIDSWGFTYKASFIWDKIRHNVGHYNSVRHEFLLVSTIGSCLPDVPRLFDSVVSIERTTHSTKPERFREIIDELYPPVGRDRVEMFARGEVPFPWVKWGNE